MGSVKNEIERLETAKSDIEAAIETCGVDVPDNELISTYASYIRQIPSAVFSGLNADTTGGTDKYIESIGQTNGVISTTVGGLVSTSKSGLVPKADGADGTIDSSSLDWVLTNNNGSIGWYKLPEKAFLNNAVLQTATTTSADYRVLFSNTADDTTTTEGARKSSKLMFNPSTGVLTSTKFSGNLDWSDLLNIPDTFTPSTHNHPTSEINKLTNYSKGTSTEALVVNDTLNSALSKLECKADLGKSAYDIISAAYDGDGTIENLNEILRVLDGLSDTVTLEAIIGNYLLKDDISPSVGVNGNTINVTVGGVSSDYVSIPMAVPTALEWEPGTTSGPIGVLSGTGMSDVEFPAIPSASGAVSGIVTTGAQTFAGSKTFNASTYLNGTNKLYFNYSSTYGINSNYISGSSTSDLELNGYSTISFAIAGYKKLRLTTASLRPITSGSITLGNTSYKFGNVYAASIGTSDSRCTYGYFSNAVYATSGFYESSDERLKNILNPVKVDLDDLAKLRKIYYTWKNDSKSGIQLGIIAQDVQKLYPELVDVDSETGYLSLAYDKLSVIALEAIDTLYQDYKKLKERIDKLERLVNNKGIF